AGVPTADLRTTDTSVHADHGPRGEGPQRFVARLGLSATVRDVGSAGSIVQNAIDEAGETARLSGIFFEHSDPSGLFSAARAAAFADALAKAGQFAELAGRELGVVLTVDDTAGGGPPVPLPRMAAMPMAELTLEGGQQEVSATVVVRWSWA
ncbi:MAG: SIMPL domain-containing protein, partial [Jiangellaceae bacterium]